MNRTLEANEDVLGITERDVQAIVPVAISPLTILDKALERGLDPVALKQLMDLQERWQANEAKRAFVQAMNAFKADPPTIRKNKHVEFGKTSYDHATLDHVCDEVTAGLSKYGISHRWEVEQANGRILVSCFLTHELGHSEKTTLEGPADDSGSKNAIQAIASAVTYLQRYTLLAATGLAAKGMDDDGRSAAQPEEQRQRMAPEAIKNFVANIQSSANMEQLQQEFAAAVKAAKKLDDRDALTVFITAKDSRKAILQ